MFFAHLWQKKVERNVRCMSNSVLLGTNKQYAHAKSKVIYEDIKKIKRNKKGQKYARLPIAASWLMIVNVFCSNQLGTSTWNMVPSTQAFVKLPELSFQVSPHCKLVKALG